jgi:hypothetical protein
MKELRPGAGGQVGVKQAAFTTEGQKIIEAGTLRETAEKKAAGQQLIEQTFVLALG